MSAISWNNAPANTPLWGVYGNPCFPTVFACMLKDYPQSDLMEAHRAIWGWSLYRRKGGYRTLGTGKKWADEHGLRLFLTRDAAFTHIANYFPKGEPQ